MRCEFSLWDRYHIRHHSSELEEELDNRDGASSQRHTGFIEFDQHQIIILPAQFLSQIKSDLLNAHLSVTALHVTAYLSLVTFEIQCEQKKGFFFIS